jgi:anti-sigma factor RsiW
VRRDPHQHPDQLEDDLATYALGALSEKEATELARHVEDCDDCQARLRWLQPAIDVLPAAVEQHTPPDRLRASIMDVVEREAAAATAAAAPARTAPARTERTHWWESLRGVMMRPATAMAVLILLVAGIGVGYLVRGSDTVQAPSTLVKAEPLDGAVPVSATLERMGDSATLHVHEMPPLANDEVYEVWVQRAGVMEPRSTFVLNSDGTAEAAVPGPFDGASAVYVTREPMGGSRQPTTDPLLQAPVQG